MLPLFMSPPSGQFDPSLGWNPYRVSVAARNLLQDYFHAYLGVVERRYGWPSDEHLPVPPDKAILASAQEDTQTPGLGNMRIYAICPGLAEDPEETPLGGYAAQYALVVVIEVLNRKGREEVDAHLSYYMEAAAECLLREGRKVFGDEAVIDWNDQTTDNGDPSMALTQGQGQLGFAILVDQVVTDNQSLFDEPPADPYEPLPGDPEIDQVDVEVFNTPITEAL